MARAGDMIAAYAAAGYEKLHLDASMGCAGEPATLADARRSRDARPRSPRARSAAATARPVYVIGTEVPTPGGATEALDHLRCRPTRKRCWRPMRCMSGVPSTQPAARLETG